MATVRDYFEDEAELDDVFEGEQSEKMEAKRMNILEEMKRYMDTETLLENLVLQGLNSDDLKENFEFFLRMNDTGEHIGQLRQEIKDIRGRRELRDFYETNLKPIVDQERFLDEMVRAMPRDQFMEIASETARLYDLPADIRDQLR